MFGRNKTKYGVALLLLAALMTGTPARAETHGICQEDEQVLLSVPGNEVTLLYAYDDEGNRLGKLPSLSWGFQAKVIRKDTLFSPDGDPQSVLRAGDLQIIASFPEEEYSVHVLDDCYVTLEKGGNKAVLYGSSGQVLGNVPFSRGFDPERDYSCELFELTDAWLLKVTDYNENQWGLIYKDGWISNEIREPALLEKLNDDEGAVNTLGNFIVWQPYSYLEDRSDGVVMTQEGLVIMDGIDECMTDSVPPYPYDLQVSGSYERHEPASFVVRNNGNGYDLYDAALNHAGSAASLPEYPMCAGGFMQGFASEELDGNVCAGFLTDCSDFSLVPYAYSGDRILIRRKGETALEPAEGVPSCISDGYYVSEYGEGTRVYRRSTGELIAEYDRIPQSCVSLGRDGIRMDDEQSGEEWWNIPCTVYDNEGNVAFRIRDRFLAAFVNGTWASRRGIYQGILDMKGKWILKDTFETE